MSIAFAVPAEVAFDYFADPRRRPEWQSSLARVDAVVGSPRVGQTWIDVTKAGVRPAMETTELDRPDRWTERGTWRGFAAILTLTFAPTAQGCEVDFTVQVTGRGLVRPLARLIDLVAPYAVRSDLRRAAGRLTA